MHEVNLNQDVKTITLIVNCNSMEDAKKLYDLLEKLLIAVIAWVRCIGVFYSKPFENFIAPHATEYRYINIKQEENTVVSLN